MKKLSVWKEIRKQLTNAPSFALNMTELEESSAEHLEIVQQQIEEALKNTRHRLIFLLGPFGAGKTTQIHHFIQTHPQFSYLYKSFIKINTLDLAFLHLTNYISRFIFLIGVSIFALLLMWAFPRSAPLPFLIITGYLFVKNAGNLMYILHEAFDNLVLGKHRLVILEDLERSSLSLPDQWALLANLWQLKRTYLIPLGYSPDDRDAKLQMIESVQKLGGVIIQISATKNLNYSLIKRLDREFPFTIDRKELGKKGAWISLFTPREMLLIQEQAHLRTMAEDTQQHKKKHYIQVCLDLLLSKLGLTRLQIAYDEKTSQIQQFSSQDLSPEQAFFLSSFSESIALS